MKVSVPYHNINHGYTHYTFDRVGSVGSVYASRTVGREFASRPGHTKDHHKKWYKLPPCIGTHALGLEFGSAAQLSKRPGSVWNCLWGNALKRSPGIIRKSRVSYPGPRFLSSATWPSLPKKHYNGLNQTKPTPTRNSWVVRALDQLLHKK